MLTTTTPRGLHSGAMDLSAEHHRRPTARTVALAEGFTLLAFVAFVVLPDAATAVGIALMVVGALAVMASVAVWGRTATASLPLVLVTLASALGLLGAVAYLRSIADEPSAIPLGGVGVLLLSLVGLLVSAVVLLGRRD